MSTPWNNRPSFLVRPTATSGPAPMQVYLTKREYQLLRFLADHPTRYFAPATIVGSAKHDGRLSPEQLRTVLGPPGDR